MASAVANSEDIRLTPYLTASGVLHGGLILLIGLSAYFHWQGNRWAGPGGGSDSAVQVKLVGNSGLPMPKTPSLNESNVVNAPDGVIRKTVPWLLAPPPAVVP